MKKEVYDATILTEDHVSIYFNKRKIGVKDLKDYAKLYIEKGNSIAYEERVIKVEKTNFNWKYVICHSDNGFKHMSFVNGVPTRDGGTHVEFIMKQVTSSLLKIGNKKDKNLKLKESDIRNHCMLFLIATIKNPDFANQIKEKLTTSSTKFGFNKFEIS